MSERPKDPGGVTRRGLFRGIGTATIVAGCVKAETPSASPSQPQAVALEGAFGATPAPLEFVLDGQPVSTQAEARTTLLELLRLDLDRTGTKLACDRGSCGACMVLVDGQPRNACMTLAHDVAGAEVRTVAGLGSDGELSPLQRAFVEHDALQCGFCTSGMLVSATALLERQANHTIEREHVQEAIAGNLCRCGSYPHIIDAVVSVAKGGGRGQSAELIRAVRKGEVG